MPFVHALNTVAGVAHCIDLPWSKGNNGVYNLVLSLRNHDRTLAVQLAERASPDERRGRNLGRLETGLRIPVGVGRRGIGGAVAILAAACALLLLRRRRGQEVEDRARNELGLA